MAVASPWVERFASVVQPAGAVLDVACGAGRHLALFASLGHPVVGIDRDLSGVSVPGAELIRADLEDGSSWPLAGRRFAAVVVTNYLWRPLYPALVAALAPGGVLIHETFAAGNEAFGRPRNPDFLLRRGELLELTQGLTVVAFEDGIIDNRAVLQRICAVNAPGPVLIPYTISR